MAVNKEIVDLLSKALESGISVFQEEQKLKFKVAKDKKADTDIIDLLKVKKHEILTFLTDSIGDIQDIRNLDEKITPFNRSSTDKIPLSYSQERLWFIDQLQGSVQYHIPTVLRLKNELDSTVLGAALSALIQRHEVLRTVIKSSDGQPYQEIIPVGSWQMAFSEGNEFESEAYLKQFIASEVNRPFDLARDYMLRAHLIKCAEQDHVLVLTMHHIASDGWSNGILVRDLMELYRAEQEGDQPKLANLAIQYADYAVWQRTHIAGAYIDSQLNWWQHQLDGIEPLELPTDYPRPSVQSTRGAGMAIQIGKTLTEQLKSLALKSDTTLFMTLLTAFKVLLYRYSGQEDICIGTPLANRNQKEVEPLVGFFINTLALRSDLSGNPDFSTLLENIKETTLSAFAHQKVPFEQIVEKVVSGRSLSHSPIFQVMFILQNTPDAPNLELGELSLSTESTERTTTLFDLIFSLTEETDGLLLKIVYCSDLFSRAMIERMAAHFRILLQEFVHNPKQKIAQVALLTPSEKQQIFHDFNNTAKAYPEGKNVLDLFEAQVQKTPDKPALVFEDRTYTYEILNQRSNQLARQLLAETAFQRGQSIGVLMERSEWHVVAMIGIMKAGGVYVPVNTAYPDERIRFIFRNSGARIAIVEGTTDVILDGDLDLILDLKEGSALTASDTSNLKAEMPANGASFVIYTSGSTGMPKGVEQTHLMLYNLIMWTMQESGQKHGARYLQYSAFSFDMSLYEIFYCLSTGGEIHVCPEYLRRDLWGVKDYILQNRIEVISMPYSALRLIFDELGQDGFTGHHIKEIISAGEQLYISGGLRDFLKANPEVKIHNLYGPSETHVITGIEYSFAENEPPVEASIGRPVSNTSIYILDKAMQVVPIGVEGEIYASGDNVALGYINDPDKSAARFMEDPFRKGARVYKTGDLAKWLPDGIISFKGRRDDQIKIRGYRIELGEIESILKKFETVKNCAVLAPKGNDGELRIAAYIVPEEGYNRAELQAFLQESLPEYMVPSLWMELDALPLSSNGKINRQALAGMDISVESSHDFVAPETVIEQLLAKIWMDLLRLEQVGIHDNFFEIGGHSLMAMRVVSAIRQELQKEIKVREIFNYPTIGGLAQYLETLQEAVSLPTLVPAPRPEKIPLSYSQERLWFIDQLGGSVQFNMPTVLRLKNELNRELMEAAFLELVTRHEVLRTVIKSGDGQAFQEVRPASGWRMDYSEGPEFLEEVYIKGFIAFEASRPFDLSNDYLLRAHLVKCSADNHVLILVLHHIATDGWSNALLIKDLVEIYTARQQGKSPNLPVLSIQYPDYAIWQRKNISGKYLDDQLTWWEAQLQGIEPLMLPIDYPRPAELSTRGNGMIFYVEKELTSELKALSLQSGATLYMTLLAAFNVLLNRYTGQEDICIGMPLANREQKEVESLVGFFINTLVLRTDLSGSPSFGDLLEQVKTTTLSAFAHQSAPFEKVVERVASDRNPAYTPLFQVLMVLQNTLEAPDLELEGLDLSAESSENIPAQYDLSLSIQESSLGLKVAITYRANLFAPATIKRMAGHFHYLLTQLKHSLNRPIDKIKLLKPEEELSLIQKFNQTEVHYSRPQTLLGQFEEQVIKTPKRIAAVFGQDELTYSQLEAKANQWAHLLNQQGVKPGHIVGICMERSLDMIIGILAIFKAGAAYLPIDPRYPEARIAFLLQDAGLSHVLTHAVHFDKFPKKTPYVLIGMDVQDILSGALPHGSLGITPNPEDAAYVIYTSGSTGNPKGVVINHESVVNQGFWAQDYFELSEDDVVLQRTTFCFDPSVFEFFWPLSVGGKICFAAPGMEGDARYLIETIAQNQVTIVAFVPSMLSVFLQEIKKGDCPGLKKIICGGEILQKSQVELCKEKLPHVQVYNIYGPTETAIHVTCFRVPKNLDALSFMPIGKPLSNVQLFIIDREGQLVPEGVIGELCIGGIQLARGYLNQPELTREKFIIPAFENSGHERIYRTGDLARWLPDGNVEYVGRSDNQLKINGFRVELGEIEYLLNQAPGVRTAVVTAKKDQFESNRLIAYVVPHGAFDKTSLEIYLQSRAPAHMVPAFWVKMDNLPLNPTGKVNRKALPDPDISAQIEKTYIAPESETEKLLAGLWMEMLSVEKVGIHDNFFVIGGHSLLAMRLVSAIRESLGKEIKVKDIFNQPTIAALAQCLDELQLSKKINAARTETPRPEKIPLSYSQQRIWFIDQFGGSTQYHMPTVLRLTNDLDKIALEAALKSLVERHETLRTVFKSENGQAFQVIQPATLWALSTFEGTAFADETYLDTFIADQVNRPFDLSIDYMLRACLIRQAENDHILILVVHHIASDGWSQPLLVKDLAEFYSAIQENRTPNLESLQFHYADYAIWQRNHLSETILSTKLEWWVRQLDGLEALSLPLDYPRPAVQSTRGSTLGFRLEKTLSDRLKFLSLNAGASMFMTLLSAFKVLLYRYTGQEDICVGTPIANRNYKELEPLVGFFINTLALRSDLSGNPDFSSLLTTVKSNTLAAFAHQEVPFEQIVSRVETTRSLSRSPIFQVMFVMQNMPEASDLHLGEVNLASRRIEQSRALFDLTVSVKESSGGLLVSIEYCSDLFSLPTIQQMASHFHLLLAAIVDNPDEKIASLAMLAPDEKRQLLHDFNNTVQPIGHKAGLLELFEQQVLRSPDRTAISFKDKRLTYLDLHERSDKLAFFLRKNYAIQPDDLIGIMMDRCDWAVVAILGVLKSGAAYVPIDTEYPQDRKAFMIADTNLKALIVTVDQLSTCTAFDVALCAIDGEMSQMESPVAPLNLSRTLTKLAYVIFTSGSTGKPKGVMVQEDSLLNYLFFSISAYQQEAKFFSFPLFTSLAFDLTQTSIFLTLLTGGELVIEKGKDMGLLLGRIVQNPAVNAIKLTPSHIHYLQNQINFGISMAIVGGEQLDQHQVRLLKAMNPNIRIYNEYGPTEATIGCTVYEINDPEQPILIGKPIANTQILILDEAGSLTPKGVPGEICIAGNCLARGYLNRPELTAERFVRHPYSSIPGAKIYRTGDIGRWHWDGNLEYLGRKDNQVKIRGYRIELGEIESILSAVSGVKSCAVVAKPASDGALILATYVVSEKNNDKTRLQEYLSAKLPDYMVPALWEQMEALPLTPAGKIDRKALEKRDISINQQAANVAPRDEMEVLIAGVWKELLNLENIGVQDNFFEVGGHSLLALRVVSAIGQSLRRELQVQDVFTYPTIEKLARHLWMLSPDADFVELNAAIRPEKIPLSYSQERLWFIDQLEGSKHYHMAFVLRLQNQLDRNTLSKALAALVNRHEALRTVIKSDEGHGYQKIISVDEWEMAYSEDDAFQEKTYLQSIIRSELDVPFNLSKDYMLRAHLFKCGENDHVLLLVIHHIASDGWSNGILMKDLTELYSAFHEDRLPNLPALPIQYADYAIWQKNHLSTNRLAAQLDWWEQQLKGIEPLELSTDYPRPTIQSTKGASLGFRVDKEVTDQLKSLSVKSGATLFMTLLSALNLLLHRYTGKEDICIGTPNANRNRKEVESVIGFFVNTLAMRSDLSGNPGFMELLERVKTTALSAFAHKDVPFEQIVSRVESNRSLSHSPIFQVLFSMQNTPDSSKLELGDLSLSSENVEHTTSLYDIHFSMIESPFGLQVVIEYCTDLFNRETMEQMADYFQVILAGIAENPNQAIAHIPMLTAKDKAQLLVNFNSTDVFYPALKPQQRGDSTIIDLLEAQVELTPERVALVFEDSVLTYQTVNALSNQLAWYIRKNTTFKQGDSIAVFLERSEWSAITMIAIMKLGGVYVPMEITYPEERTGLILENSGANIIIVNNNNAPLPFSGYSLDLKAGIILAGYDQINLNQVIFGTDPSYLIYTSGSTGVPKGVEQTHLMLYNLILWNREASGQLREQQYLQYSSFSFDMSLYEIYYALSTGGQVHICSESIRKDFPGLKDYIIQQKITTLSMPYSALKLLFDELCLLQPDGHALREIISAGEQLYINGGLRSFLEDNPEVKIYNLYGPSETHVVTGMQYHFSAGEVPVEASIGKPINNTKIYILDKAMQLVPRGVVGEIYIGGQGLALGYKGNERGTAEKFLENPFKPGEKIYKTGDFGKWLPNGTIKYQGRNDDQVKIRGYRIELGDIESALSQSKLIKSCAVLAKATPYGERQLVAYIVPESQFDKSALQRYLSSKLPGYMIPAFWVEMESLPTTTTGKVKKKELAKLELEAIITSSAPESLQSRNELEKIIAGIWQDKLNLKSIGIQDNFFEVGGHSLNAISILFNMNKALNTKLTLMDLFANPSIEKISSLLTLHQTGAENIYPLNLAKNHLPNLFLIPPVLGVPIVFNNLATDLAGQINCYGHQYRGVFDKEDWDQSIEQMAARVISGIFSVQQNGVFHLCGYSMGATIAYEVAKKIEKEGHKTTLVLLDRPPLKPEDMSSEKINSVVKFYSEWLNNEMGEDSLKTIDDMRIKLFLKHNLSLLNKFVTAGQIQGTILALEAKEGKKVSSMKAWAMFTKGAVEHVWINSGHYNMLDSRYIPQIKKLLLQYLAPYSAAKPIKKTTIKSVINDLKLKLTNLVLLPFKKTGTPP